MKTAIDAALDAYFDALMRGLSHREAQKCAREEAGQYMPDLANLLKEREA